MELIDIKRFKDMELIDIKKISLMQRWGLFQTNSNDNFQKIWQKFDMSTYFIRIKENILIV